MTKTIGRAVIFFLVLACITGVIYPLVVTGITTLVFPAQAHGSLLYQNGKVIGSALIGQDFSDAGYFHGRPSSAGENGYDGTSSGGTNWGPTNKNLINKVKERTDQVRIANGLESTAPVPSDLVTASASGLDPHISRPAADLQIPRVAKARNISEHQVKILVEKNTEQPQLGFLGEPRVNVLKLNLELDSLK